MAATQGYNATLKLGVSASPTNNIGNAQDYDMPLTAAQYDVSVFGSGWNSFLPGLRSGTFAIKCNYDMSDTNGQVVLKNAYTATPQTLLYFIFSADGTHTATFTGYVKDYHEHAPVNNKADLDVTIQITGAVVFA